MRSQPSSSSSSSSVHLPLLPHHPVLPVLPLPPLRESAVGAVLSATRTDGTRRGLRASAIPLLLHVVHLARGCPHGASCPCGPRPRAPVTCQVEAHTDTPTTLQRVRASRLCSLADRRCHDRAETIDGCHHHVTTRYHALASIMTPMTTAPCPSPVRHEHGLVIYTYNTA